MINTKNFDSKPTSTTMTNKEKIEYLRVKHQPVFTALGISDALFFPKMAYKPAGRSEYCISLFENELVRAADIYTEFVSRNYESEDDTRSLYLWRYNPHWEEEYERTTSKSTGSVMYLVPVSELVKVDTKGIGNGAGRTPTAKVNAALSSLQEDANISELTIRDLTAILTGEPVSNKEWLNKILSNNNK